MSEEAVESKNPRSRIPGLVIFYIILALAIVALVFTYMFHAAIIVSVNNAGSQTSSSSSMMSSGASSASSSPDVIGGIVVAGVTGLALGVALAMVYATDILIIIVGVISLIASIRNRGKDKIGIAYDIGIVLSVALLAGAAINFLPIF